MDNVVLSTFNEFLNEDTNKLLNPYVVINSSLNFSCISRKNVCNVKWITESIWITGTATIKWIFNKMHISLMKQVRLAYEKN